MATEFTGQYTQNTNQLVQQLSVQTASTVSANTTRKPTLIMVGQQLDKTMNRAVVSFIVALLPVLLFLLMIILVDLNSVEHHSISIKFAVIGVASCFVSLLIFNLMSRSKATSYKDLSTTELALCIVIAGIMSVLLQPFLSSFIFSVRMIRSYPNAYNSIPVHLTSTLRYDDSGQQWILDSQLVVPMGGDLKTLEQKLIVDGWSSELIPTSKLSAKALDRSQLPPQPAGIYHKHLVVPESIRRWHVTSVRTIPLLNSKVDLDQDSSLTVDAPNNMIIDTFPQKQSSEPLLENDYVRFHIAFKAFTENEDRFVRLKIAYPTLWAKLVTGLKWSVTGGLKWLIGVLLTLAGGIIATKLDKIKKLFEKEKLRKVGFGAGQTTNVKPPPAA